MQTFLMVKPQSRNTSVSNIYWNFCLFCFLIYIVSDMQCFDLFSQIRTSLWVTQHSTTLLRVDNHSYFYNEPYVWLIVRDLKVSRRNIMMLNLPCILLKTSFLKTKRVFPQLFWWPLKRSLTFFCAESWSRFCRAPKHSELSKKSDERQKQDT